MATRATGFKLRPTLLASVTALLVLTIGSLAVVIYVRTSRSVEFLVGQHFEVLSKATESEVQRLLAPAPRLLDELGAFAARGLSHPETSEEFGRAFVERLRSEPNLGWLGYADAEADSFVGGTRPADGSVRLNRSAAAVNGGRPGEWAIADDGTTTVADTGRYPPYSPRARRWFQEAMERPGIVWQEPYAFTTGEMGITASRRLERDGRPVGVFLADFFLRDVERSLRALVVGRTGRVAIVTPGGTFVGVAPDDAIRPVLDAGLAGAGSGLVRREVEIAGTDWEIALRPLDVQGLGWRAIIAVPEEELSGIAGQQTRLVFVAGLLALLGGLALAALLANRIAGPVRAMSDDLEHVRQLRLSDTPSPSSFVREVKVLGDSINRMKAAVRSFQRYVPPEVVRELVERGEDAALGGARRRLSIHFSDVEGFTAIAERLSPEDIAKELAQYLALMDEAIHGHGGTVDKYMGDGVLAFFNAPRDVENHERAACAAALEAQERLAAMRAAGGPTFRARIGLHVAEVLVGNFGSPTRFAYTILGDAVNLAARLEPLNKQYGTWILASEAVRSAAGDAFEWRRLDRVQVVGRKATTEVFELLARAGQLDERRRRVVLAYERALETYFAGDFVRAREGFDGCLDLDPDDRPSQVMRERCATLEATPQPEWTGAWSQLSK